LNAGGSLDTTFNPGTGADGSVYSVALQSNGRAVIGGSLTASTACHETASPGLGGDPVAAVTAARFRLPTVLSNQNVQLVLSTDPGATYVIDASVESAHL